MHALSAARIARLERELERAGKQREELVASRLHDAWRQARPRTIVRGRPQYEPRLKHVDGVEYDIANITFSELPMAFRASNLDAARFACKLVHAAINEDRDIDDAFLDSAAAALHEEVRVFSFFHLIV
jgi:hypothetical protein